MPWEASALLQLPVYHISGIPHGLQPQDYAGAVTSAGDLFPEKKRTKNSTNFVTFLHFWSQLNFNWLCNLCSSKVFLWIFSFKEL
jgi:hypothetical protein